MSNGFQQDAVLTRSFGHKDKSRLIAWAGIARPGFLGGAIAHKKHGELGRNVERFLRNSGDFVAVCCKGDFCKAEFKGQTGLSLSGPVAAIDSRNGKFFIDPALKMHPQLEATIRKVASLYGTPTPMHA